MSHDWWAEPGASTSALRAALEKQREEVEENEEVKVPHTDRRPMEASELVKHTGPPEQRGWQEVTSEEGGGARREKTQRRKKTSKKASGFVLRRSFPSRTSSSTLEPRGSGPFFFFGGVNGETIVSGYCESRGWKRIHDRNRDDFKLKWCETKSAANYGNFREGEQLLFQIPNNGVLTTKIGLLCSLRDYDRVSGKVGHGQRFRGLKMDEFVPATFRMDVTAEREEFFNQRAGVSDAERPMWICKPTGLNRGRGIFLLKNQEDIEAFRLKLKLELQEDDRKRPQRRRQACVVQHYIQKPLLLGGRKFDVRSYLLIACTSPYVVFFGHGYVRLTCGTYDPDSNSLCTHLTNQYLQKQNPLYGQLKEDTVWSMRTFNAYVNERLAAGGAVPRDWVLGAFTKRMQQVMTQCFLAVKSKLNRRLGFFDLIGCDFMVDEDFKVWLLEMNCNPALHTNCEVLKDVVPGTVVEALDLSLEIFHKCRLRRPLFPLASQRDFVLLYNGAGSPEKTSSRVSTQKNAKTSQKSCTSKSKFLTLTADPTVGIKRNCSPPKEGLKSEDS